MPTFIRFFFLFFSFFSFSLSLLKQFNEQQQSALENYVETALIMRYNRDISKLKKIYAPKYLYYATYATMLLSSIVLKIMPAESAKA